MRYKFLMSRIMGRFESANHATHVGGVFGWIILAGVLWVQGNIACDSIALGAQANDSAQSRPNIVLFLADDLGWTGLRCFGSDFYETPHLDALAQRGIRFTDAYAACTVCSPTRASIMTGMYPARLRLTDFIAGQNRPFAKMRIPDWTKQLDSSYVTIAEALRSDGYRTGHIGKWHLSAPGDERGPTGPLAQGFDVSIDGPAGRRGYQLPSGVRSKSGSSYLTDWLTDRACEFIEESEKQPFFLYFAYHVPHTPIQGREDLVEYFRAKVRPDAVHRNPVYAAMVASLDQSVGRVLETLEQQGVSDNTVIVFISDNGGLTQRYGKLDGFTDNHPLRRGKGSAYEGGVRVPMIVHWPGVTPAGTTCSQPVMTIDFYPTCLEIAGIPNSKHPPADEVANGNEPRANRQGRDDIPEQTIDGVSLVKLFRDPTHRFDRSLFWHYPHYHAGGDGPYSAVRHGNDRLIEFHEDGSLHLYDLQRDLGEENDLAQQMPEKRDALYQELVRWRKSVGAQMPTPNPDYDPARAEFVRKERQP